MERQVHCEQQLGVGQLASATRPKESLESGFVGTTNRRCLFYSCDFSCTVLCGIWMAPIGGRIVVVRFFNSRRVFWHRGDFVSLCAAWASCFAVVAFFLAKSCVDKEARACRVNEACATCDEENEVCDVNTGARTSNIHSACTERLVLCNCSRAQNGLL
jgi:hypothetical protein